MHALKEVGKSPAARRDDMIAATARQTVAGQPLAGRPRSVDHVRAALVFSLIVIASALLLQRFGIPAGSKSINVVGPIGLGAAAVFLSRGTLSLSAIRLVMFLALCLCAVLGLIYHAANPSSFAGAPSMQSLLQFLIMTSFATLSFAHPAPERRFFRLVTLCLGVVAAAGLLQFVVQFAGLRLFSFRGLFPARLLFEDGYNLTIPSGIGSLMKSNGFFLLEPSIFSQFMALALVIELLTERRALMLALFAGGLVVSASGTGWIVLLSFVLSAALSLGSRGIALAAATVGIAGLLLLGLNALAPDVVGSLASRLSELTRPSTSGHLRFITPFWVFDDVLARESDVALAGLGAGVSERLTLPYEYDVNTPVKIGLEFGLPALLAYLGLLGFGRKSPVQRGLMAPGFAMLLFTGAYQQFPPVLFFILLIISVARLAPEQARPDPPHSQPAETGSAVRSAESRAPAAM